MPSATDVSSASALSPLGAKRKNRWLIAVCAVGIHVCIGAVYAYSVYAVPIREAHGWSYGQVATAFSLAIGFLGLSAAFLGRRIEKQGPRASARLAACLYASGLALAGVAMLTGSRTLFYLGYGVLGGIGLGVGYLAPVATLVKWFPDRRGLAAGLAIMGFGFGALLGGPVIAWLIAHVGLAKSFWVLAVVYFAVMMASAQYIAPPPEEIGAGRKEAGGGMAAREAVRTRRFWYLWAMLFINITCGIAVLAVAAPMGREIAGLTAAQAATMVGLMGLFNGLGRIGWAALSDRLGRPAVFVSFFAIQLVAVPLLPSLTHAVLFQAVLFLVLSCYGGGFATAPAYVSDLFGTKELSTIYGYLLTAWSAAGVVGPLLAAEVRDRTGGFAGMLYIFAALFVVALGLAAAMRAERRRVAAAA